MASWTEDLQTDTRVFRVKFGDQSVVTYRVRWSGHMDAWVREDGSPSTWDHPWDDRRCFWSATGYVKRQVMVVVGGQDYMKPDLTTVFTTSHLGEGGSFVLTNLRPENCNDCQPRRDSDFSNVRNAVNGSLQATIGADLETVKSQIRALNDVVEVTGP